MIKDLARNDSRLKEHYGHILEAFPDAKFEEDTDGSVFRFKRTDFSKWVADNIDLNAMAIAYATDKIELEEYMKFYQDKGSSICHFEETFGEEIAQILVEKRSAKSSKDPDQEYMKERLERYKKSLQRELSPAPTYITTQEPLTKREEIAKSNLNALIIKFGIYDETHNRQWMVNQAFTMADMFLELSEDKGEEKHREFRGIKCSECGNYTELDERGRLKNHHGEDGNYYCSRSGKEPLKEKE
jgi:hypothetical protein